MRPEWRHAVKVWLNIYTWSDYLFDSADPKVPLSQSLRWHDATPPTSACTHRVHHTASVLAWDHARPHRRRCRRRLCLHPCRHHRPC